MMSCLWRKKVWDAVFDKCGSQNCWNLVEKLHNKKICPEWEDPHGSSQLIVRRTLLMENGKTEQETEAILESIEENEKLDLMIHRLS